MRWLLRTLVVSAALVCAPALSSPLLRAQENSRLSEAELLALAQRCAPRVAPDTIEAVVRQESALHPYALSVNYPRRAARALGFPNGQFGLARQPRTREQALHWAHWFVRHGYTVSVGLMQINIEQAHNLGLAPSALFDPCTNIAAGGRMLADAFRGRANNLNGLADAFAVYNAGSVALGHKNGYAAGVVAKAP